jgi:hypothetical protein
MAFTLPMRPIVSTLWEIDGRRRNPLGRGRLTVITFQLGAMLTLGVGMKTRGKSPHAHGKREHGTLFWPAYLENLIGARSMVLPCRITPL